jgi:dihydrofolate reductase
MITDFLLQMDNIIRNKKFSVVVAATEKWGIGNKGTLPWRLKGDLAYFKKLTTECVQPGKQNAVIMGRATWESIPLKFRPLPDRLNIVLTRSVDELRTTVPEHVMVVGRLDVALMMASMDEKIDKLFVIGGAMVYKQSLQLQECHHIHLTTVKHDFECDTFISPIDETVFSLEKVEQGSQENVPYEYRSYNRIYSE